MANTAGDFNPPPHPASSSLARPSLHDMVLEHDGPLPFIWRNLVKWHGGKPNPDAGSLHQLPNGHDAGRPPHKRRRLSPPDPTATIASTLTNVSERFGHSIEEPPSSAAFLRLELSSVAHRESVTTASVVDIASREQVRFPAMCRVTLYQGQSIFDRVLHCQSLPCELILSKNAFGAHDIFFAESAPAIFIPKHALNVAGRNKGVFGFSQSYFLTIDLETGDGTRWPPLSLPDMGVSAIGAGYVDQCSVLRATTRELLGKMRLPVDLVPNVNAPVTLSHTHFVMRVDAGWADSLPSLSLPSRSLPTPDNTTGSPQRTMTSSGFAESLAERNLHLADDDDDDHVGTDGAPTPSRSLRARRTTMIYNLKDLSDKQLGRDRRRDGHAASVPSPRSDQICWQFSTGESIWAEAHRCLVCRRNTVFKNFNQLVNHIETAHTNLKYEAKVTRRGHMIEIATDFKIDLTPTNPLKFVRQAKHIDVQAYQEGDQSWVSHSYEEGPDVHLQTPRRNRHLSATTPTTRKSKSSPQQLAGQKRRRIVVPYISETPLYHPVSKQLLTPGEELPRPAPDKQWILQKYREALHEFSDITAEEREYMFKWDSFLQPLNVTTAAHLPEIWLAFVDKHADWLVDREHRMLEFTKHAALLFGRSLINSSAAVTQRLNVARRLKQDRELQKGAANGTASDDAAAEGPQEVPPEDDLSLSPRLEHVKKGNAGCLMCKLPVRGPKQLLCTSDGCLRLFHSTCVEDSAKMPVKSRRWRCNTCLEAETAS